MSPNPVPLPCPCGSVPLSTQRCSHLCGSRCCDVSSPSEGVHAVSAQHCGFGRGVASGPQISVALPALHPVALPNVSRLLWRIVLRAAVQSLSKIMLRRVLPLPRGGPVKPGSGPTNLFSSIGEPPLPESRGPFFETGNALQGHRYCSKLCDVHQMEGGWWKTTYDRRALTPQTTGGRRPNRLRSVPLIIGRTQERS